MTRKEGGGEHEERERDRRETEEAKDRGRRRITKEGIGGGSKMKKKI